MSKSQILDELYKLEEERKSIVAEQESINYTMTLVMSDCSSRMDEISHSCQRRQMALEARKRKWEERIREIEAHANDIAA